MDFIGDEAISIYIQEIASKGSRSAPLLKLLAHFQKTENGGEKPQRRPPRAFAESVSSFLKILIETRGGTYIRTHDSVRGGEVKIIVYYQLHMPPG
jgi:hypothetical protein